MCSNTQNARDLIFFIREEKEVSRRVQNSVKNARGKSEKCLWNTIIEWSLPSSESNE